MPELHHPQGHMKTPPRQMGAVLQSGTLQRPRTPLQDIESPSHFPFDAEAATDCIWPFAYITDVTSHSAITPITVIVLMCEVDD